MTSFDRLLGYSTLLRALFSATTLAAQTWLQNQPARLRAETIGPKRALFNETLAPRATGINASPSGAVAMRFLLLALVTLSPLAGAAPTASLDDPVARAALPEFRFIPAADPASLAPAAPDHADSKTWPRSQGDNASRRYSALTQITRENIKDLAPA